MRTSKAALWISGVEALGGGVIGGYLGAVIGRNEAGRDDTLFAVPAVLFFYVMALYVLHEVFGTDDEDVRLRNDVRAIVREELDRR